MIIAFNGEFKESLSNKCLQEIETFYIKDSLTSGAIH